MRERRMPDISNHRAHENWQPGDKPCPPALLAPAAFGVLLGLAAALTVAVVSWTSI